MGLQRNILQIKIETKRKVIILWDIMIDIMKTKR